MVNRMEINRYFHALPIVSVHLLVLRSVSVFNSWFRRKGKAPSVGWPKIRRHCFYVQKLFRQTIASSIYKIPLAIAV